MKTISFSILLLSLAFINVSRAQSIQEEAANFAADYICNCVNTVYTDIEPEIRELIMKIYLLSPDEQSNFIMNLAEETQTKVIQQSLLMSSEAKAKEFEACNKEMDLEIEKKFKNVVDSNFSESKMIELMLDYLSKKNSCSFAYSLMKIGIEMEVDNK